ncbi:MAG TPA: outer membrane protein assembly factor BamD, partial [Pirellulaceae bacterium]|nr:outer membrane protein assembly factor BamD [Pirellulaceae bacterium]
MSNLSHHSCHNSKSGVLVAALLLAVCFVAAGCQSFGGKRKLLADNPLGLKNPAKRQNSDVDPLDPMGPRNINRLVWHDLAPDQIGTTFKTHGRRKKDEAAAKDAFDEGQRLYRQALATMDAGDPRSEAKPLFDEAAKKFKFAASRWPDSAIEQDALFFEGESLFFADRYVQANRAFEKLLAVYSGTRYLDRAQARRFAIAQYWLALARAHHAWTPNVNFVNPARPGYSLAAEARRLFHRIRLEDPTGKLADDATMALANAYFEAKMYQDAADTYEDLRRTYPGSTFYYQASVMELKSRLNSYYGQNYDASPLVKADALIKQIVVQFPNLPEQDRELISREAAEVRHLLAERDYSMGEYYERRGENRAAGIMYNEVAQKNGE